MFYVELAPFLCFLNNNCCIQVELAAG